MSRERVIGVVNLCVALACIVLATHAIPRTEGIVKIGIDRLVGVIDSEFLRRDLTEVEKNEYESRKAAILSQYNQLRRANAVARRSILVLLLLAWFNGITGITLLSKRAKMDKPMDAANTG